MSLPSGDGEGQVPLRCTLLRGRTFVSLKSPLAGASFCLGLGDVLQRVRWKKVEESIFLLNGICFRRQNRMHPTIESERISNRTGAYGEQIVVPVSRQLAVDYGRGYSKNKVPARAPNPSLW